jgi:uncharacterized protein
MIWKHAGAFVVIAPFASCYFTLSSCFGREKNHTNRKTSPNQNSFNYYQFGRLLRTLGIFGLVMVLYKSGWFHWLFSMLRPVGQMALTNYLMQSLICGLLFNGFAFGLYGSLQRYQEYEVVAGIWVFQIIYNNIWMRYLSYGPAEWIWRCLTYWKRLPFAKRKKIPVAE